MNILFPFPSCLSETLKNFLVFVDILLPHATSQIYCSKLVSDALKNPWMMYKKVLENNAYTTSHTVCMLLFSVGELEGAINANPQHFKDTVRVDLNTIVEELARIPCVQENTIVSHTTTNLNLHFYLF